MIKLREIEGRWRIFGKRGGWYFGVLKYAPEIGLTLSVRIPKARRQQNMLRSHNLSRLPTRIQGYDKHDHPITLFGCITTRQISSGGLATYDISAIYALLGRHFSDNWDKLRFS